MKPFAGYEANYQPMGNKIAPLPAGAYVGKILGVSMMNTQYGEKIVMNVDVTEGEYKDYFKKRWENDKGSSFGQKWKGVYRLSVPGDENTEINEGKKRGFNSAMGAIEKSNYGYKWGWDEQTLKGKNIGFAVRDKEWEMNSQRGMTTEIAFLCPVEDVRAGKVNTPNPKMLQRNNFAAEETSPIPAGYTEVVEDDLPF